LYVNTAEKARETRQEEVEPGGRIAAGIIKPKGTGVLSKVS
jgi:hypothetical protein